MEVLVLNSGFVLRFVLRFFVSVFELVLEFLNLLLVMAAVFTDVMSSKFHCVTTLSSAFFVNG